MSDDLVDLDLGLRDLTTMLLSEETLDTTLRQVVAVVTRCLTGGSGASISLMHGGSPSTAHASDERVASVDAHQFELYEGPAIDAIKTGEVQRTSELGRDERWPQLGPLAAACGIRSVLALPLTVRAEVVGALTVYADDADAFAGDEVVQSAVMLAAQASVSVANARTHEECVARIEQLQEALDSRVVIEQAKGVLMERHRVEPDAAFDRLREASQQENRRLRLIAAEVVASVIEHR